MFFALLVPFAGTALAEHGEEPVDNVELEPDADSAAVGVCNAFTVTATDDDGDEAEGEVIDVQASQEFQEGGDQPNLRFCDPRTPEDEPEGQEPAGDGQQERIEDTDCPTQEGANEDCEVIHGEFVTDENGQVTFGIMSDEEGETTVTAFHETDCPNAADDPNSGEDADEAGLQNQADGPDEGTEPDFTRAEDRDDEDECNDEPDAGEPQDTSIKTWTSGEVEEIDCEPEEADNQMYQGRDNDGDATGDETVHEFDCTATNEEGDPVGGEELFFEVIEGPNADNDGDEDQGAEGTCFTATGEEDDEFFIDQE